MWTGLLGIIYVFKGKYSKISVKAISKGYCFGYLMATGWALINVPLIFPRHEPPIGLLAKQFCRWVPSSL